MSPREQRGVDCAAPPASWLGKQCGVTGPLADFPIVLGCTSLLDHRSAGVLDSDSVFRVNPECLLIRAGRSFFRSGSIALCVRTARIFRL